MSVLAKRLSVREISFGQIAWATAALLAVLLAVGWLTRVPPAEKPYLKIAGSGFMFNYRVADAYYGFTAYVLKPVKPFSVIEAEFENPAGGPPLRVREELTPRSSTYGLRSPPVTGVEKDKPYHVKVRLIEGGDGAILYETNFTVASQLSDAILPKQPTVIGPGYTPNPRLDLEHNHRG